MMSRRVTQPHKHGHTDTRTTQIQRATRSTAYTERSVRCARRVVCDNTNS